jgi:hypothetical protein
VETVIVCYVLKPVLIAYNVNNLAAGYLIQQIQSVVSAFFAAKTAVQTAKPEHDLASAFFAAKIAVQ